MTRVANTVYRKCDECGHVAEIDFMVDGTVFADGMSPTAEDASGWTWESQSHVSPNGRECEATLTVGR